MLGVIGVTQPQHHGIMYPRSGTHVVQRLALASLAALFCACSSDVATPSPTLTGSYTLRLVNGNAPPGTISQNSQRTLDLVAARLEIAAGNRFTLDDTVKVNAVTGTSLQVDHRTGTYTVSGSTLSFTADQPGILSVSTMKLETDGSLSLTDLTGSVPVTLVFRR